MPDRCTDPTCEQHWPAEPSPLLLGFTTPRSAEDITAWSTATDDEDLWPDE